MLKRILLMNEGAACIRLYSEMRAYKGEMANAGNRDATEKDKVQIN